MKKTIWILIVLTAFSSLFSCGGSKDNPVDPQEFNISGVVLPASMQVQLGQSVSLEVKGGHGPLLSDIVVLKGTRSWDCVITKAEASSFSFTIPSALSSGNYEFYIKRGGESKKVGKTMLTVVGDVDPQDATVYGMVLCEGKALSGVVVSDGVEVTSTDNNGVYRLRSAKLHGYVFVSVPSGYEVASKGVLPQFYQSLDEEAASVVERKDFTLSKSVSQDKHTVFVLGDMHLANRTSDRSQFSSFVTDLNAVVKNTQGPKYGLTLGDMTWDCYWKTRNYGYREYIADANAIQGLSIFHTIGNHDHSMYEVGDFDTVKEYKTIIGPTYYSFNIGKVHYVVLDDVECTNSDPGNKDARSYNSNLVQQQLDWLEKDLALVPKTTPLVVSMHIPLYEMDSNGAIRWASAFIANARKFEDLVKPYPQVHLFTAHTHKTFNVDNLKDDHIFEHNSGAVCATWWWSGHETPGVHIGQDGSPGGYAIMHVDGTNFSWEYKATGSDVNYQFRSYDRNSIHLTASQYVPNQPARHSEFKPGIWESASTANEVYLNIWNYDPSWSIEVKENGKVLPWTKVSVKDPLHLIAYTAKRLNAGNKDAAPLSFPTDASNHIFKVTASSATSTLIITVTDRFGNTYMETMTRPKLFSTDVYKISTLIHN